ncbi:hypothetical protein HHI36_012947 [Cryptolaemus montrouzieri]|uniref:Uncharacterized protein n=1 Tax=Cryptolaemus montrouzieri TaxID=559131 RepID=A0ABD2NFX5_9CUCU
MGGRLSRQKRKGNKRKKFQRYKITKTLKNKRNTAYRTIKSKNGTVFFNEQDQKKRRKEYFEEILNERTILEGEEKEETINIQNIRTTEDTDATKVPNSLEITKALEELEIVNRQV